MSVRAIVSVLIGLRLTMFRVISFTAEAVGCGVFLVSTV